MEQQELSPTAGGNAIWYNHFKRQFFIKLDILLLCDLANHALRLEPKWTENVYPHKTMHNAGLVIVPKLGSNQDIPQWMDKLWYIHTMEGDSVIIYTQIVTAVLSVIAQNWKQPKYLLTGKWVKDNCGISIKWMNTQQYKWIIDTCSKMDQSQNSYGSWKKSEFPLPRKYISHDFVYINTKKCLLLLVNCGKRG